MNKNQMNSIKGKTGIDVTKMKQAAEEGKLDDFINKNLSQNAANQLQSILSDKSAAEKLLSTPEAKELMKKLMGDK